jgi:hypothetical protein
MTTAVVIAWPQERNVGWGMLRTHAGQSLRAGRDALLAGTDGALATPFLAEEVLVVSQDAEGTATSIRPIAWITGEKKK